MLTLLRRIRKKLLAENRLSKYTLYAIGEIVLVVIGILIALGINNWNEDRKAEERTRIFLTSLKSDLSIDSQALAEVVQDQKIRSEALSEAISLGRSPDASTILSGDTSRYFEAGRNLTFFPTVGAFKAANNAGLLENIEHEELKRSILNLYEHLYVRVIHNGEILDERTGIMDWESRRYIQDSRRKMVFSNEALLDSDFIDQMGFVNRFIGFYLLRCEQTQAGIEKVLGLVDDYLGAGAAEQN